MKNKFIAGVLCIAFSNLYTCYGSVSGELLQYLSSDDFRVPALFGGASAVLITRLTATEKDAAVPKKLIMGVFAGGALLSGYIRKNIIRERYNTPLKNDIASALPGGILGGTLAVMSQGVILPLAKATLCVGGLGCAGLAAMFVWEVYTSR